MKYLVAAVALATFAASPAFAAKGKMSCAGDGPPAMMKKMASMPADPKLFAMNKAWFEMNSALAKGNMRGCTKAMMRAHAMM